ncbi:MAG TPA: formyltransferase family protein [Gemmatimonadales bacterium]|nr:formyltransferase family protein [Gemmatimonadales bacterium]
MLNRATSGFRAPRQPVKVALLTSGRAPGIADLLGDPARGRAWELVLGVTSDQACASRAEFLAAGIPLVTHDLAAFYARRGAPRRDLGLRVEYDQETLDLLRPHRPDLLVLSGYLHILTVPVLAAFPDAVINVHDSDLTLPGDDGKPRYRGLRSTRDAIVAGERETRVSAHLVTAQVDVGPVLVRSEPFPTHPMVADARRWGATDILKAYAYAQREWMMRAAWGRVLRTAIRVVAEGRFRVLEGRAVVNGAPGPFELAAPGAAGRRPKTLPAGAADAAGYIAGIGV